MKWRIRGVKYLAQGYKAEKLLSWNFNPEDPISNPYTSYLSTQQHKFYKIAPVVSKKDINTVCSSDLLKNQIRWCLRYKKGKKKNKTDVWLSPVLQSGCTNEQITLKGYKSV